LLHYLVNVIDTLFFTIILIAITLGIYAKSINSKALSISVSLGFFVALAVAIIRLYAPKSLTREYYDLSVSIPLIIFLIALTIIIAFRSRLERFNLLTSAIVLPSLFLAIAYSMPDIFIYPFEFANGLDNIYDREFGLRVFGYSLPILTLIVLCYCVYKISFNAPKEILTFSSVFIFILVIVSKLITTFFILYGRRMIPDYDWLTDVAFFIEDRADIIFYLVCAFAALIALSLYLWDKLQTFEGANPAIIRKKIADSRKRRRFVFLTFFFLICAALFSKGGAWLNKENIELSPLISVSDKEGVISFSLDEFDDGHLRRYVYKTKSGTDVKFLIIKKKRGGYGVGLDACEICGVSGYYEDDDKVICSRCGVAINTATIGFRGGCNPIPFAYEITNSMLNIYVSTLEEEEGRFK
jgi:uncharacterized membrane protein